MATVVLIPNGRLGNNLFQLSLVNYLKIKLPDVKILFPSFPELGILQSDGFSEALNNTPDIYFSDHRTQIEQIADYIRIKPTALIHCTAWGMTPEIYSLSQNYLRGLVLHNRNLENKISPRDLTFHIRGGDLWQNAWYKRKRHIHMDYSAVPISFYKKVLQTAKINSEFIVESSVPEWYLKMLRKSLGFELKPSTAAPSVDFQRIAQGNEIGLGVSTFSWMAAFIGRPTRVHMPILGIFDMGRRPDLDFKNPSWTITKYEFEEHCWSGTKRDKEWLQSSDCQVVY